MPQPAAADQWRHSHRFDEGNPMAERGTRGALLLTTLMMLVEIAGGWVYNSMALLADGWHMSSHVLALGLSVFAYVCARKFACIVSLATDEDIHPEYFRGLLRVHDELVHITVETNSPFWPGQFETSPESCAAE